MKFFKHFTNAHSGESLLKIRELHGAAGYGCFFILLELCVGRMHRPEDRLEHSCEFRFPMSFLAKEFGMKRKQTEIIITSLSLHCQIIFTFVDNDVIIKIPNLLKFLNRDDIFTRSVRVKNAPRIRRENKKVEIEVNEPLALAAPATSLREDPFKESFEPDYQSTLKVLEKYKLRSLRNQVSKILRHFGNYAEFAEFVKEKVNANTLEGRDEFSAATKSYLFGSIVGDMKGTEL